MYGDTYSLPGRTGHPVHPAPCKPPSIPYHTTIGPCPHGTHPTWANFQACPKPAAPFFPWRGLVARPDRTPRKARFIGEWVGLVAGNLSHGHVGAGGVSGLGYLRRRLARDGDQAPGVCETETATAHGDSGREIRDGIVWGLGSRDGNWGPMADVRV